MNLLLIAILWIISIGASYTLCFTPIISLIKGAGEKGYKINYNEIDKMTDIIDIDESEKIKNILMIMPIINIIYSLNKASSLIQKKALIISCINKMDAFKKMTAEEVLNYSRTGNFYLLIKNEKNDEKFKNNFLKFTLKNLGLIDYNEDCNAYYCVNNSLEESDNKSFKTLYEEKDINISDKESIKIADKITKSNKNRITISIGYLVKNPKLYNSKYKFNSIKLYNCINKMKEAINKYNEESLVNVSKENLLPCIKENILSISLSEKESKLVNADTFFNEIEKNGYTSNIKFTSFNELTYKLLLSKTFGLDIELKKNNNLYNENSKTFTKKQH